jgi:hypothetical protein
MASRRRPRTFVVDNVVYVEFSVYEERAAAACSEGAANAPRLFIEPAETRKAEATLSASGSFRGLLWLLGGPDRTLGNVASSRVRRKEEETF